MDIPNLPSLHPYEICTTRPVRLLRIEERKVVEDVHGPDLFVDDVASILRAALPSAITRTDRSEYA
jgi:hypothetical protein